MGEPYSPAPGVELLGPFGENRGVLIIGDRRWPALRNIRPVFTDHGLDAGWMAELWFENGAIVLFVAHPEHAAGTIGKLHYTATAYFGVSLHHQFGPSPADRWESEPYDLPIAAMDHSLLDLHPDLGAWQLHEYPEAEWLNWWLWRVGGLSAPEQRRAVG